MLPEFLSDSYSRYKEDTNVFATWLTNTASLCGYKSSARLQPVASSSAATTPASTRLKGNARKEARANEPSKSPPVALQANRHILATSEIIVQAALIAGSKKPMVKVPLVIQGVLRRAIRARKRCTLWFQQTTSNGNKQEYEASNSSHEHFIDVLEETLKILEPCFDKSKPIASSAERTEPLDGLQAHDPISSLNNRFEKLAVEDTPDESLDISVSEIAASTAVAAKSLQNKVLDIYELERSMEEELQFRVFCFFEDLHRVEDFLKETWQQFADGQIDLVSASLVTNVTLTLVRESEEAIKNLSPKLDIEDSYRSIVSVIHPVAKIATSFQSARKMLQRTPLDRFVFRSTFVSMLKSIRFQDLQPGECSTSMISISDLYKMTGTELPEDEDIVREDHILTLFLLDINDLVCLGLVKQHAEQARRSGQLPPLRDDYHPSPFADEIITGLKSAMLTRNITVANVFQSRVLLSVQKILNGRGLDPYQQLRYDGASAYEALGFKWPPRKSFFEKPVPEGSPEEWIRDWGSLSAIKDATLVSFGINKVVKESVVVGSKQAVLSVGRFDAKDDLFSANSPFSFLRGFGFGAEHIEQSLDPAFLYNHNPVYCGMEKLKILVGMEDIGVSLSNRLCSFAPMAHLYNALRQTKLLTESWPAMDHAIKLNMGLLFNGRLPATQHQIVTQYLLCFRGEKRLMEILKKLKFTHAVANSSRHFEAYLKGTDSAEKLLYNMIKEDKKRPSMGHRSSSLLEMLEQLRDGLPQTIIELDYDRITLSRQCARLLQLIHIAFKTRLGISDIVQEMGVGDVLEELNYIFVEEILTEAFPQGLNRRSGGVSQNLPVRGARLPTAANVTKAFILKVKAIAPIKPFDIVAGKDLDLSQTPRSIRRLVENFPYATMKD
ncbi:hypothetical protein N431DRAFT_491236 [Stipitochalara longipes BDJ]|nr:hypothetical protein N431DRAFT_491236 [Stipitochalara longipes BDJ]